MLTNDTYVYVAMNRDHLYELYTHLRALAPEKPVYYIHTHPAPSDLNVLSRYMIPVVYDTKRTGFFKYLENNSEEARRAVGVRAESVAELKDGRAEFIMEGEGEGLTWEQIILKND